MSEDRLNSLESHMQQLIQMVAENNKMVVESNKMVAENTRMTKELSQRMDGLEKRMGGLEKRVGDLEQTVSSIQQDLQQEKELNRQRHQEVLKELRSNQVDIDYLRNQVSRHDMEINKLKVSIGTN